MIRSVVPPVSHRCSRRLRLHLAPAAGWVCLWTDDLLRPDRLDAGGHESAMARLMMIVLALLAFVLAANAVVAFAAISKLGEPRGP